MVINMKNRKRIASVMVILSMLVTILSSGIVAKAAMEVTPPPVTAQSYVMMDANSGEILFEMNGDKRIYPASTIKLMTAVVALENTNLTKKITTKASVLNAIAWDATKLNFKSGVTFSLEQWLNMLLIYSAADAADTIAEGVSGSVSKFVKQMNTKAKALGMNKTHFDNSIGLDIGNNFNKMYSTARDMAILSRYAMSNQTIRSIVSKASYTIPATSKSSKRIIDNTNKFVSSKTYNSKSFTVIGTKTGSTKAAGKALIATAEDAYGHEVICAFFGAENRTQMYSDIYDLFDYTFSGYEAGYFELESNFYDTRLISNSDVFATYYGNGVLTGDGARSFAPNNSATQKMFASIVNRISEASLDPSNPKSITTAVDVAEMLYSVLPYSYNESSYEKTIAKLKNTKGLTKTQLSYLVALYQDKLLPNGYGYDVTKQLTKADAVIFADLFKDYLLSLE